MNDTSQIDTWASFVLCRQVAKEHRPSLNFRLVLSENIGKWVFSMDDDVEVLQRFLDALLSGDLNWLVASDLIWLLMVSVCCSSHKVYIE
ncbi:hypothetical protein ACFX12_013533 [Malus domestica]